MPLRANAPNQLWSWDITYLATTLKGSFFYLYLIMDVFSRKIVGWEVYDSESTDRAAVVFRKAHLREGINADALVLHSDNGSPMKGATMLATLQKLGVIPSFSRPSVSNDNPYSEALFKTLKYPPGFPDKPFENLEEARQWVTGFVHWYNETHRHSHLRYVTQSQRHRNEDIAILAQRHELYQDARDKHPERWSGKTRNWQPEEFVNLNPGKPVKEEDAFTQIASTTVLQKISHEGTICEVVTSVCFQVLLTTGTTWEPGNQGHHELSAHCSNRARTMTFRPYRRRRGVGNLWELKELGTFVGDQYLRREKKDAQRSGMHKLLCIRSHGGEIPATRVPDSLQGQLPV